MKRSPSFPFTTSMRRFEDDSTIEVETFFAIHGTTIVFNTNLVESITLLPVTSSDSIWVRLNNQDGTCSDRLFSIINDRLCETPTLLPPTYMDNHTT